MAKSTMPSLDRLLAAATARLRMRDAAWGLARLALPLGLLLAALGIVGIRRLGLPPEVLWACALPMPTVLAWAWLRPRSRRVVARLLDRHHDLDDQLGSALELGAGPSSGRKPVDPRTDLIAQLVRERAEALSGTVDPRPAVPVRVPGPRALDGVALAMLGLAMLVPEPTADLMATWTRELPRSGAGARARVGLDLALADPLRQSLRELKKDDDKPAKIAEQILEVLDALERGDIDRALALEKLEELEKQLADAEAELQEELREDPATLAEAVEDIAAALQEEELTAEAGKALDQGDGDKAEAELNDAGEQADAEPQSDEQLKAALEKAEKKLAEHQDKRESSETAKQLDEAERRLRKEEKKKPENKEAAEEQERRLKKMKEKVEELRRQHEREMAAQKKVEELRRGAKQTAKSKAGSQERKRELQKLSRGMKEASRTARSSRRMQGARDSLEEAKTFVRRAGQSGQGEDKRRQQFKKFNQAASGKDGKEGKEGKDGKGKGKGKSTLLVEGQVGEGDPSHMMEMEGQDSQGGQDGEGQGGQDGQDSQGDQGDGEGDQGDQGDGQNPGNTDSQAPSDGIGEGSTDPLADPTDMKSHTKDVRVKAKHGRGVSKAEILQDASQNGFATEPYRNMYKQYRDFAQSAIDSDAFPAAQRRLVKRYLQMIQGR
jgi:hypothetical protein